MSRARRNPIGLPAPPGDTLVRAGTGKHTHVLSPSGGMTLCKSGVRGNKRPKLYRTRAKFITCYRCIKLVEGRPKRARTNPRKKKGAPHPGRWGWEEMPDALGRTPRWVFSTHGRHIGIIPQKRRELFPILHEGAVRAGAKTVDGFQVVVVHADWASAGHSPEDLGWYSDLNQAFEVGEAQLSDLERLALEAPLAKRNTGYQYPAEWVGADRDHWITHFDTARGVSGKVSRWSLRFPDRYYNITRHMCREKSRWVERGFKLEVMRTEGRGMAAEPELFPDLTSAFEAAEANLEDLERLALEAPARKNPLTERVFSPSYDAESQEDYDVLAYMAPEWGGKLWDHVQVQGGRRAARFSEFGPFPRDPKEGGPRRTGKGRANWKIEGGKAGPVEVAERTIQRLQPRDEEGEIIPGTQPWAARTQSLNVWVMTLDRMGYPIPEEALERAHQTRVRQNPVTKGNFHGFTRPHWKQWVGRSGSGLPMKSDGVWFLDLGTQVHFVEKDASRGGWVSGEAQWTPLLGASPYLERYLYVGPPASSLEDAMDLVEGRLHDLERLALEAPSRQNPKSLSSYGKKGPSAAERKLTAQITDGFNRYRSQQSQGGVGLYVPRFPGPLIDAGVPKKVAYELVRRAGGHFYGAAPSLAKAPALRTLAEVFVAHFGQLPSVDWSPTLGKGLAVRGKGHISQVRVSVGDRTLNFDAEKIEVEYRSYQKSVKEKEGNYRADLDDPAFGGWLLTYINRRARTLAHGSPREEVRIRFDFTGSKDPVVLRLSALQHSVVPTTPDTVQRVRYRNLENIPLAVLPALLARIALRTKRKGRRTQHLSSPSNPLENPMSYWEKQYSQGPFGGSSSVPAARRNRGRPRTGKLKHVKLPPAPDNDFVRMTGKELERDGSRGAKAELKRRNKDNKIVAKVRGYDTRPKKSRSKSRSRSKTTSRSRSKSGKGLSEWNRLVQAAAKLDVFKMGMNMKQVEAAIKRAGGKKRSTGSKRGTGRKTQTQLKAALKKAGLTRADFDEGIVVSFHARPTPAQKRKQKKQMAKYEALDALRDIFGDGDYASTVRRKVSARKPRAQKANGRKTTWPKFRSHAAKRGYSGTQASSKWKSYKAGKGTIASLLPPKKARKARKNKGHRGQDRTHIREALVPAGYDYWDNSVPTALRNGLALDNFSDQRRGSLASDPWHPVYEQMIGQFSTQEGWADGDQPMNRRSNPKKKRKTTPKKRKARKNRGNPDAKRAMQLYHSGQADSLGDAWDMVRNGY